MSSGTISNRKRKSHEQTTEETQVMSVPPNLRLTTVSTSMKKYNISSQQAIIDRAETMFRHRESARQKLIEIDADLARLSVYRKQLAQTTNRLSLQMERVKVQMTAYTAANGMALHLHIRTLKSLGKLEDGDTFSRSPLEAQMAQAMWSDVDNAFYVANRIECHHKSEEKMLLKEKKQHIRTFDSNDVSIHAVTMYALIKTSTLPLELIQMIGKYTALVPENRSFRFCYNKESRGFVNTHHFRAFDTNWEFSLRECNELSTIVFKPLLIQLGSTQPKLDGATCAFVNRTPTYLYSREVIDNSVHYGPSIGFVDIRQDTIHKYMEHNGSDLVIHLELQPKSNDVVSCPHIPDH